MKILILKLHKLQYMIRFHISNFIFQHKMPFYIAHTEKLEDEKDYPPVPYDYNVLAEFDLPDSNRHYIIYLMMRK